MVDILRAVIDALELQGLSENVAFWAAMLLVCVIDWLHTQAFSYAIRKLPFKEKNLRIMSGYLIVLLVAGNIYYFMKYEILLI